MTQPLPEQMAGDKHIWAASKLGSLNHLNSNLLRYLESQLLKLVSLSCPYSQ